MANIARGAYEQSDGQGSRQFHEDTALRARLLEAAHQEPRFCGDMLKPLVFGGLDGMNTTFAVIAGAVGADLSVAHVLIMGFVCLFAGAFSMGLGECTSSKAEIEFQRYERDREAWEMENFPEGEVQEMVDIYKKKGVSEEDARILMTTMSKYKDIFIDHMMVEELGILPPAANKDPRAEGRAMFTAFGLFGSVPLLSFIAMLIISGKSDQHHKGVAFAASCVLTAGALLILGAGQANYRKQSTIRTCLQMLFNGLVSGSVAYCTGLLLNAFLS